MLKFTPDELRQAADALAARMRPVVFNIGDGVDLLARLIVTITIYRDFRLFPTELQTMRAHRERLAQMWRALDPNERDAARRDPDALTRAAAYVADLAAGGEPLDDLAASAIIAGMVHTAARQRRSANLKSVRAGLGRARFAARSADAAARDGDANGARDAARRSAEAAAEVARIAPDTEPAIAAAHAAAYAAQCAIDAGARGVP